MRSYAVILTALVLTVSSCSKKETGNYTSVYETGADSVYVYRPALKFTIPLIKSDSLSKTDYASSITKVATDPFSNIYIFHSRDNMLCKYSPEGILLGTHTSDYYYRKGGEVFFRNGYVHAASSKHQEINKYGKDMNYLSSFGHMRVSHPAYPLVVDDSTMIGSTYITKRDSVNPSLFVSVSLMDTLYNIKRTIYEFEHPFSPDIFNQLEFNNCYAVSEDMIYLAGKSDDKYEIHMFDHRGNPSGTLRRVYEPVRFRNWEKEKYLEIMTGLNRRHPYKQLNAEYKKPVNFLTWDKYNKVLWSVRSTDRQSPDDTRMLIDIFRDNRFFRTVSIDTGRNWYDMNINDFEMLLDGQAILIKDIKKNELAVYQMIKL